MHQNITRTVWNKDPPLPETAPAAACGVAARCHFGNRGYSPITQALLSHTLTQGPTVSRRDLQGWSPRYALRYFYTENIITSPWTLIQKVYHTNAPISIHLAALGDRSPEIANYAVLSCVEDVPARTAGAEGRERWISPLFFPRLDAVSVQRGSTGATHRANRPRHRETQASRSPSQEGRPFLVETLF